MKNQRIFKRLLTLAMGVLLALSLLPGCGSAGKPVQAVSTEAPASDVSGYFAPEQPLSGGQDIGRLNLRDIKVTRQQDDLVVKLTFMDGSAKMDMTEAPAAGVPLYSTRWYPGVGRLAIRLEKLAFWDYRVYPNEIENTLIAGIFKQLPIDSETTVLYLNMKGGFAYRMESVGNQLFIYLRATEDEPTAAWYVAVDGFAEYAQGQVPDALGLAPCLCDDQGNIILLSAPFAGEAEAQAFIDGKREALTRAIPGKSPTVITLSSDQLPAYDASAQLQALLGRNVCRVNEQPLGAEGFIKNGRFLCWHPDGRQFLFIRPIILSSTQEDNVYIQEQIWSGNAADGTVAQVLDYDFLSVLKAAYSHDGKYIAFLEQTEAERVLQIVEVETGIINIAAEDDFGIDTSDFVWDEHSDKLYAITGEPGAMQIMGYDLSQGNPPLVTTLEEEQYFEGDITLRGGVLYLAQSDMAAGEDRILSYDLNTNEKRVLTTGYSLSRPPAGDRLAVFDLLAPTDDAGSFSYCLKVYDLETGEESVVDSTRILVDAAWSRDGASLYYTVYRSVSSLEDEFPLSLFRYDVATGQSTYLMDLITGALYPGQDGSSVLLMVISEQMGRSVAITYKVPVS